jgi:hypothetical protein
MYLSLARSLSLSLSLPPPPPKATVETPINPVTKAGADVAMTKATTPQGPGRNARAETGFRGAGGRGGGGGMRVAGGYATQRSNSSVLV